MVILGGGHYSAHPSGLGKELATLCLVSHLESGAGGIITAVIVIIPTSLSHED